jgi:hypothetical protein
VSFPLGFPAIAYAFSPALFGVVLCHPCRVPFEVIGGALVTRDPTKRDRPQPIDRTVRKPERPRCGISNRQCVPGYDAFLIAARLLPSTTDLNEHPAADGVPNAARDFFSRIPIVAGQVSVFCKLCWISTGREERTRIRGVSHLGPGTFHVLRKAALIDAYCVRRQIAFFANEANSRGRNRSAGSRIGAERFLVRGRYRKCRV